jgi:hypothetical protein
MKSITFVYGLLYLAISLIIMSRAKKLKTSPAKNIFWSFTAFSAMKFLSIFSGLSAELFPPDYITLNNHVSNLTAVSSIVSNVFLFHFGISILTYRTSMRIDYKIFPLLLLTGYIGLHLLGIIEFTDSEIISRYSFGFDGALLGGIGCIKLYKMKKESGSNSFSSGLVTCGIALILFAFTEGFILKPLFGIKVNNLRTLAAFSLFISSFFLADLLKEEEKKKIAEGKSKIGFV